MDRRKNTIDNRSLKREQISRDDILALISVGSHYEQFLRRHHEELNEEEIALKVQTALSSPDFRNHLSWKDALDEQMKQMIPNWKSWYD